MDDLLNLAIGSPDSNCLVIDQLSPFLICKIDKSA